MRVLGKNIIIEEIAEGVKETAGGLLLAEVHRDDVRFKKGKIVDPGEAVEAVKAGDIIHYDKRAGYRMLIPFSDYLMINESDIVIVET